MVFMHVSIQFWTLTRIRIRNLEFRIRIRQKVPDPCGSGSTTLLFCIFFSILIQFEFCSVYLVSDDFQYRTGIRLTLRILFKKRVMQNNGRDLKHNKNKDFFQRFIVPGTYIILQRIRSRADAVYLY
jgi:hypothetical protein